MRLLAEAKAETGLPVVTELMDIRDLDAVLEVADVIQIGARNMQNYPLLAEIGRSGRPALLKRGLSSTLDELLMAAEYILKEGNPNVMLCERGIRTFETAYRFTLDLMAVPVLKELSHLPVIVDPSHAAGRRDLVLPLSLAAAAAGADGIIVEVHPNPDEASATAPRRCRPTTSPSTRSPSSRRRRWPARRSARSDGTPADVCPMPGQPCGGSGPLKVAVLGIGLIGGSIGLAARARAARRCAAMTPTRACARGAPARRDRRAGGGHRRRRRGRDVVFVAAPVGALARDRPRRRSRSAGADSVVTDVGSTKRRRRGRPRGRTLHRWASPRRGRDGGRRARARRSVRGRRLVPDPRARHTAGVLYERLHRLLDELRRAAHRDRRRHARPPDGVASRICRTCSRTCSSRRPRSVLGGGDEQRLPAVGPSFRDATRVAGANTAIWTDIYLSNSDALIAGIDEAIRPAGGGARPSSGDAAALAAWNDRAHEARSAARRGARGGDRHELRVSVPNRPA